MRLNLRVWRQLSASDAGRLVTYPVDDVSPDMSFLEVLDVINERLIVQGERPIAFDHDCREGICGSCGFMIGGVVQGPLRLTTACQLFMRHFSDGETVVVEPFRAGAAGYSRPGCRSHRTRQNHRSRWLYFSPHGQCAGGKLDLGFQAGRRPCDGRGGLHWVRGLRRGVSQCLGHALYGGQDFAPRTLPQGQPERRQRALRMVNTMDVLDFGSCTNHGECEAVCPKGISIDFIARLNRDFIKASLTATWEPIENV